MRETSSVTPRPFSEAWRRDVMVGNSTTHDDDGVQPASSADRPILTNYCPHPWKWDVDNRSPDAVVVNSTDRRTVLFHPSWSNGTAAIRGTKPLDSGSVYYWEVELQMSPSYFLTYLLTCIRTSVCRRRRHLVFRIFQPCLKAVTVGRTYTIIIYSSKK